MNLVQRKKEPPRDEQTVQKRHKQYSRTAERRDGGGRTKVTSAVGLVGSPWQQRGRDYAPAPLWVRNPSTISFASTKLHPYSFRAV
jgi:hypothetical protein